MLLAAGILASAGSLLILIGAFLQARRAFDEVVHGTKTHGAVEHTDDNFPGVTRLQRWWNNSRWVTSAWRDTSLLDPTAYRAWMLILAGSALVLSGSVITAVAAA